MSYRDMNNPIVWIDCEMTGLDLDVDELVEVAVVITDSELNPVDEGIDVLVRPSDAAVEQMGDFVRQMHTASGLIEEWKNGLTLKEAREQVLAYIRKHVPEAHKAPLGGNSVGTDKAFLEKYMPDVVGHLHYPAHVLRGTREDGQPSRPGRHLRFDRRAPLLSRRAHARRRRPDNRRGAVARHALRGDDGAPRRQGERRRLPTRLEPPRN